MYNFSREGTEGIGSTGMLEVLSSHIPMGQK